MQTNDVKQYWHNHNCFEKTKEAWGIFSFFLPQMSKRRTSALLPITLKYTKVTNFYRKKVAFYRYNLEWDI